jgi:hypothetical protein
LWLADTGFLFVLREREVTGFVVPADLNKQAGRAYFYLALTEFELALSASIRHAFPAQTVLLDTAVLTRRQIEKVVSRQRRHAAENQDSDLVAEFDLVELCAAAGADERLRCVLESASARTWSEIFPALQPLRNAVAHSNRELLAGVTVAQMAEAVRLVERMTVALR